MDVTTRRTGASRPTTMEGHGRTRARVRSLLLGVVLIPTVGMLALATISARENSHQKDASVAVEAQAKQLEALMTTQAAITEEQVTSSILIVGADLGVSPAQLHQLYGIDFGLQLAHVRSVVDEDPLMRDDAELARDRQHLAAIRRAVDDRTADFSGITDMFETVELHLEQLWSDQFDVLDRSLSAYSLPGRFRLDLENVDDSHRTFTAGGLRTQLTVEVLAGTGGAAVGRDLIDADSTYRTARTEMTDDLGPRAAASWAAFNANDEAQSFESTISEAVQAAMTGRPSTVAASPAALGDALFVGVRWNAALIDVVRSASADLSALAVQQEAEAARAFRLGIVFTTVLTALSLLAAGLLARAVSAPLNVLAGRARAVREGRLDIQPVPPRGPRELADTAEAFNEMVVSLGAVEARAVAMADDLDSPVLSRPIPGRTGEALDRAFDLLQSSMRNADASRAELEHLATHDGLTGLLNRTAAIQGIDRDLTRVARDGGSLVVLFLDLDGLKQVNDTYGHDVGDEVLRSAAAAMRAATRSADIVARLGGDEFLVAGVTAQNDDADAVRAGIGALAQRLADSIEATSVEVDGERIGLRCSIGVAVSRPEDRTADGIISRADARMYVAKQDPSRSIAWHDEADRPPALNPC